MNPTNPKEKAMNLKPFNLDRALAGDPVVTREGKPVTDLVRQLSVHDEFKLCGVLSGARTTWKENGGWHAVTESPHDLFMSPRKVVRWVNFRISGDAYWYNSKDRAEAEAVITSGILSAAVPVEVEE
jgi:hypothetical protein